MKPELSPNVSDVVLCVRRTLEDWISPALQGKAELSYVTTATHLLSYVERRIEHEGQVLFDEAHKLRDILSGSIARLAGRADGAALSARIAESVDSRRDPNVYLTLRMVSDDVAMLRQHVCDLLIALQHAEEEGVSAAADQLRRELRDYIAWQLACEGTLVEPAFRGRGARR